VEHASKGPAEDVADTELDVLLLARLATCCCCSPSTVADAAQQWEDGERRKKKMICGARESVIRERAFNAIYVFVYTCNWARLSPYVFHVIFMRSGKL